MSRPAVTPASTRTNGPPGSWYRVMRPGPGQEVAARVLGVDPALDRGAPRRGLDVGERPAERHRELERDEVEPGHHLGHRVLHLEPGVHLEEVERAVLVHDAFDRARVDVAGLRRRARPPPRRTARGSRRRTAATASPRSASGGGAGPSSRARRGTGRCRACRRSTCASTWCARSTKRSRKTSGRPKYDCASRAARRSDSSRSLGARGRRASPCRRRRTPPSRGAGTRSAAPAPSPRRCRPARGSRERSACRPRRRSVARPPCRPSLRSRRPRARRR